MFQTRFIPEALNATLVLLKVSFNREKNVNLYKFSFKIKFNQAWKKTRIVDSVIEFQARSQSNYIKTELEMRSFVFYFKTVLNLIPLS